MKRSLLILLFILFVSFLFPPIAKADIGPKPSLKVIVKNPPTGSYYLDLLIDYEVSYPYSYIDEEDVDDINMYNILKNYNVDGWRPALVTGTKVPLFGKITGKRENDTMIHTFSYLGVPDRFKVIIVEESGEISISNNIIERKAFDSTVYFDYATKSLRETSTLLAYIKQFLITYPATLIVEGLILLLFGLSLKRNWKAFMLVNLITQTLLTLTVFTGMYFQGSMAGFFYYIPIEILIVIVELRLFKKYLVGHSQLRKKAFAIVANIISFIIGIVALIYVPYI